MTQLGALPGYLQYGGLRPDGRPASPSRPISGAAAPAQSGAAIDVTGLRVDRGGRTILRDLSFRVQRGSVTALLGPSGCGKSTLIRAIMGVQRLTAGTVSVLGEPAGSRSLRSRIGYVTQAPALYDDLSAQGNLGYFARLLGVPDGRVDEVLDLVDLGHVRRQRTLDLSGGQRARVSLAAALLGDPDLLVLDEPTVGLDPVLRRSLWATFEALAERGTTLLVSSHVMDEAARCDELILLRDGGLLAVESPARLRARSGEADLESAFLRIAEEAAA